MQKIINYITEKFRIGGDIRGTVSPKSKAELIKIIKKETAMNKDADLNFIDTSCITDMSSLFDNLNVRLIDISNWDVSNVENMDYMFWDNSKFNCDISGWRVEKVKSMRHTFDGCKSFDQDLSRWDTASLEKARGIFTDCKALEKIPKWAQKFL